MKEKGRLGFLIESIFFKIRRWLSPPVKKLREAGIQQSSHVLDFGCGIGSYSIAAARIAGPEGRIYAVDCQPLAISHVNKLTAQKGLSNVQTILTDCDTGLESGIIDVVLMYDVFHDLEEPERVLEEMSRVLKKEGTFSFSDHHIKKEQVLAKLPAGNRFRLLEEGCFTFTLTHSEKQD